MFCVRTCGTLSAALAEGEMPEIGASERLTEMAQVSRQMRMIAVNPRVPRNLRYEASVMADHILELSAHLAKLFDLAMKRGQSS